MLAKMEDGISFLNCRKGFIDYKPRQCFAACRVLSLALRREKIAFVFHGQKSSDFLNTGGSALHYPQVPLGTEMVHGREQ